MSPAPTKADDDAATHKRPAAQLKMQLTTSKKKKKRRVATASGFAVAGGDGETTRAEDASRHRDDGPLVIPAQQDTFKKAKQQQVKVEEAEPAAGAVNAQPDDQETVDAVRALEEQATGSKAAAAGAGNRRIIPTSSRQNIERQETQQYRTDLEGLPEELSETADAYQTVPIAEFGAALLRGMGWKGGDDDDKNISKKDDTVMPRPHRLGLGAIPATNSLPEDEASSSSRRPQRPDQFQRQKALREQQDQYARERAAQVAADRQRTLQNGSLVWLVPSMASSSPTTDQPPRQRRRRARVVQLVGVPGLNRVAVVVEGGPGDNSTPTTPEVIQRNEIERLLTRQELEDEPFREGLPQSSEKLDDKSNSEEERKAKKKRRTTSSGDNDNSSSSNNKSQSRKKDDRKKRRRDSGGDEGDNVKSSSSKRANSSRAVWLIPNIRVRVISEKLGRRHYKEKGVVVDVTPAGATLEMSSSSSSSSSQAVVLDHVPERYLETALPKVGGRVIALAGPHKWTKGRLLERDARKGVIQVDHDMNVHTLPLDDLAEWCGPLDDE